MHIFGRIWGGLLFFAIVGASSVGYSQMELVLDSDEQIQIASSKSCAKCHQDIYSFWKESLHARSLEDNIFQSAFMLAVKQKGDGVRGVCLGCHAPTTLLTNDLMLEQQISAEGITCDFCHRISRVGLNGQSRVKLSAGTTKYGPLEPSDFPDSHPSMYSELFKDSKFCASCHQWENSHGITILDTYQEWLNGPYPAKNVHCQNCHMPLVQGSVSVKSKKEKINSHNLAGGHSITQVASAAKVAVASVSRIPSGLRAVVEVGNAGSGHMLPTGMPSRSLVLEVELLDARGSVVETQYYVFKRTILDSEHNELAHDADLILNGAIVSKDNRIPPGETAVIPFDFAAAPGKAYSVRAKLRYRYTPLILKEEEISIEMGIHSKSSG